MMKRFIVFGGEMYYAKGRFNDLISSHDTLEEAQKAATDSMSPECRKPSEIFDWYQIYDSDLGEVVEKSTDQAYCQFLY